MWEIDDALDVVERKTDWGSVYFKKCPACGSFVQSPQLENSSLAKWYDSDDYQRSGASGKGVLPKLS